MLWKDRLLLPTDPIYAAAAAKHGLELALVLAIAEHESSFRVGAVNPEPKWIYFWDVAAWKPWRKPTAAEIASEVPPADFPSPPGVPRDAEWWLQQMSAGPMQVMLAVARELGYRARCLGDLLADPETAVDLGCRFMAKKMAKYPKLEDAISAYNAGVATWYKPTGNKASYVDPVMAALGRHRARIGGGA